MRIFFTFFCCLFFLSVFAKPTEQVVILGSGPAGLTAAIYSARAGLSTLVIEGDEPGGQIALSYGVDNFPGFPQGISGFELVMQMREQAERFGARIKSGKLIKADFSQRPFTFSLEGGETLCTETLIIASGASAKWLGLDSEKFFIGKGDQSMQLLHRFAHRLSTEKGHDRRHVQRVDVSGRHGQRDQQDGHRISGGDR